MVTNTTPTTTPDRREWQLSNLERANRVRLAAASVKIELAAGLLELADAIADERAGSLTAANLLKAVRGVGEWRANRVCDHVGIRPNKRVDTLTARQRHAIVSEVRR